MNNNNVLEEFFVWEEKSLIDQSQNLLKNEKQDNSVITIETKTDSTPKDWRDITDPKLRKTMYHKVYYENNKNKKKSYYESNKEKILEQRKTYGKSYRKLNKNKIYEYRKRYRKTNVEYKIGLNLRSRLCNALQRNTKSGSAVKDLGCSIGEFKTYLESKFQSGMNWDNYGYYGWHIDHIKPLTYFDLTDRNQLLEACHYTNLQPLWAKDNLIKSNN